MAPPRAVARDSPMLVEIRVSGESAGRSIFTELAGSSVVSCAVKPVAHRANIAIPNGSFLNDQLFEVDIIDRHSPGVDVARPNRPLGTYRLVRDAPMMIQKHHAALSGPHFQSGSG